jgi:cell division protein FtsI (penicillin-binding protein 3)
VTGKGKPNIHTARLWTLIGLLLLILGLLIWRMLDLTLINRAFYKGQGDARTLRVVSIPAYRGMITDRNGQALAISTPMASIWINPQQFDLKHPAIRNLCELLGITQGNLQQQVLHPKSREFQYLKRGLSPPAADKIMALGLPGLYSQRDFRRFYPEADVTAHILGFTNIDDQGQEGVELAYNDWLRGVPGKKRVLKDRAGRIIADVKLLQAPQPGKDVRLSIDRRVQYIAYRELQDALVLQKASAGSVVVLDARNNEILAMVNLPAYNPNQRYRGRDPRFRNRAVTDVFEPGSVIKAFTIAVGLASGKYTPNTIIETGPGSMMVANHVVKDIHNYGTLTVTDVLVHSSNVGVTKMILSIDPKPLWNLLQTVGFGQRTGVGFPGESSGSINPEQMKRPFDLATLSFGYGLAVTPLQLAQAYSVFASDGVLHPVSLVADQHPPSRRVLPAELSRKMLTMLHAVTSPGGGGQGAQIQGYSVAGKTATARIASAGGYDKDKHIATFIGITPVNKPRLVIAVVIHEPAAGQYYGSQVAAPVFAKIASSILRQMNVPPDQAVVEG